MTLRVLIADDEPLVRQELAFLLAREPGLELAGEARNGLEAVSAVRSLKPDLLLLDVQMPGLDGFGVLCELEPEEIPAVIFVTAYDQYALKAFEVHAADYLLKPVVPARFSEAVQRARGFVERDQARSFGPRLGELLRDAVGSRPADRRLAVPDGRRILLLPIEDVFCVQAAENYVLVHTAGRRFLLHETLTHVSERFDPASFARVHRSWIVNLSRIREILPKFHRTYVLVLEGGLRVPVSGSYRAPVEGLLRKGLPGTGS